MKTEIFSVGSLRAALAGLPDDQMIAVQLIAVDGECWVLRTEFAPANAHCSVGVITCRHPQLKTLPASARPTPPSPRSLRA